MLGILTLQFDGLLVPGLLLLQMPLAFSGGAIALVVSGFGLKAIGLIAFLTLIGVSLNHGIVLLQLVKRNEAQGLSVVDAVRDAVEVRFRPIPDGFNCINGLAADRTRLRPGRGSRARVSHRYARWACLEWFAQYKPAACSLCVQARAAASEGILDFCLARSIAQYHWRRFIPGLLWSATTPQSNPTIQEPRKDADRSQASHWPAQPNSPWHMDARVRQHVHGHIVRNQSQLATDVLGDEPRCQRHDGGPD